MEMYRREVPLFSLCGLNCGLCPRYHTDGTSKCPGCGGQDFHLKHPACAVITCNKKHDNVEYCFQCSYFPCDRYTRANEADSFITYRKVLTDFEKARLQGLEKYQEELNEKINILQDLLERFNDGRRKSFYCNAVNLMDILDLKEIMEKISVEFSGDEDGKELELKEKANRIVSLLKAKAAEKNIALDLRKT